jgi:hypothetical protein
MNALQCCHVMRTVHACQHGAATRKSTVVALTGSVSSILDYNAPPPSRAGSLGRTLGSPWLLLPVILLVAAGLRWFQLGHESFWLDEFLAVENATGRGQAFITFPRNVIIETPPHLTRLSDGPGFAAIWTSLGSDTHPPLYFMLLNVWRNLFGESDLAARALSVTFSLLAIVLLFDVARLLHGRTVALWAALLMALAGPQIQYAQEARNYTMLMAVVLGACDALVRIEKYGGSIRRTLALGGCVLATLLTHYLGVFALAGIGLYAMIRLRGRDLKLALGGFACAGVIFAVAWGPFLLEQVGGFSRELSAPKEAVAGEVTRDLRRLAILPLRYFTEPLKRSIGIGHIAGVMYALPLLLLRTRRDLLLWCLLGGCVILPVFASDLFRSAHALAYVRYTLLASVPAYALAAAMLWHMKGMFKHLVPLVLAVSCIAALEAPYAITKADAREMAAFLGPRCDPDDVLVIYTLPDHDWQAKALYLGLSHYGPPRSPILFTSEPPTDELAERIGAAREIWMMSPTLSIPFEEVFPDGKLVESQFFPFVGTVQRIVLP